MDEIIIGAITNKEIKEGVTNEKAWKRCIFTIGTNFKVSTFNNDIIDTNKVGDVVKAVYKTEGQYHNLIGFDTPESNEVATAQSAQSAQSVQSVQATQTPVQAQTYVDPDQKVWIDKDKRIVRQNCNDRAVELLDVLWKHAPHRVEEVLQVNGNDVMKIVDNFATHFEERVWRDL